MSEESHAQNSPSQSLAPSNKGNPVEDAQNFVFAEGASHDLRKPLFSQRVEAEAGSLAAGSKDQPNGAGSPAKDQESEMKDADMCRACEEPKAKGSAFCQRHKRGFQCIYNRCCKKDKQGNYVDPVNAARFHRIFGEGREGPPNVTLANSVVIDFIRENPECKDGGKKRGNVNLARYVDQVYAKQSTARMEDECLWDEELFVNKFKVLRGWSQQYAQMKFKELEADPNVFKDKMGMGGGTRVSVPATWTGEDRQRKNREIGQQKMLERSAKNAKLNDSDCMKVEEEMASGGFKMMDVSSLNRVPASWSAPLPASSITN